MNEWVTGLKKTKAAHKIIMEISLLIMEKSWNNHGIWILNFCGNPDYEMSLAMRKPTFCICEKQRRRSASP